MRHASSNYPFLTLLQQPLLKRFRPVGRGDTVAILLMQYSGAQFPPLFFQRVWYLIRSTMTSFCTNDPMAASNSLLTCCSGVVIGKVVRCPLAILVRLKISCLLLGVHFEVRGEIRHLDPKVLLEQSHDRGSRGTYCSRRLQGLLIAAPKRERSAPPVLFAPPLYP